MRKAVSLSSALLLMAVATSAAAIPPQYTIAGIGDSSEGTFFAQAINNSGQVLGAVADLYSQGRSVSLGKFDGSEPETQALNDAGEVAGNVVTSSGFRAVRYSQGQWSALGSLGGDVSAAYGINNRGQITGCATTATGACTASIYTPGQGLAAIGPLAGGTGSAGIAINDAGQVTGNAMLPGEPGVRAFLYANGNVTDLAGRGPLGNSYSQGNDINNKGQVVGFFAIDDSGRYGAFVYSDGVSRDIGNLGSVGVASAEAINDSGVVVGFSNLRSGAPGAFVYEDGTMYDMNHLIAPGGGNGWTLQYGIDINNAGQIAGQGLYHGEIRSFIATPVPEASTVLSMLAGLTVLGIRGSRRRLSPGAATTPQPPRQGRARTAPPSTVRQSAPASA